MKNILRTFCLFILCTSCEEDIVYEFASTSISSSDFELCSIDNCPDVSLSYIEFNSPEEVAKVINSDIESILFEQLTTQGQEAASVKEAVEMYLSNSQNSYPENSQFSGAHQMQMNIEVLYTSNDLITIQNDYYQFAGGAHGMGGVGYWNYDPKMGKKLETSELFDNYEEFTAFAKAKFIKTYGSLDQFWFEEDVFALPENMGFNETGLLLFYNVYEIAPYAEGTFQLEFTWDEVQGYLGF